MSITERVGFGPLEGLPTHFNKSDLTTTAAKATLATPVGVAPFGSQCYKVEVSNLSTTATVAWTVVKRDASAPTITADAASTGASPIAPSSSAIFSIPADRDLYVVASAAATSVHVTSYLFAG